MAASEFDRPYLPGLMPSEDQKQRLPAEGRPSQESLLEEVLRHTEDLGGGEPLDPAEIEAFREVARRWQGQPLTLEPVATDLVRAALRGLMDHGGHPPEAWQPIVDRIAAAVYEDPAARQRLAAFWTRLSEGGL